jgi:hypothetical protein
MNLDWVRQETPYGYAVYHAVLDAADANAAQAGLVEFWDRVLASPHPAAETAVCSISLNGGDCCFSGGQYEGKSPKRVGDRVVLSLRIISEPWADPDPDAPDSDRLAQAAFDTAAALTIAALQPCHPDRSQLKAIYIDDYGDRETRQLIWSRATEASEEI